MDDESGEDETFRDILAEAQKSEWSKKVFNLWVSKHPRSLSRVRDPLVYLDNVLRDIFVIERIIKINKLFIDNGIKNVVMLFSSTRKRTQSILRILEGLPGCQETFWLFL
jgi:hypothetical protein